MQKRTLASALALVGLSLAAQAAPTPAKPVPAIVQKYIATVQNARSLAVDVAQTAPADAPPDSAHLVFARPNKLEVTQDIGGKRTATLVSDGKTLWQWDTHSYLKQDAPPSLDKVEEVVPMGLAANWGAPFFLQPAVIAALPGLQDHGPATIRGVAARKLAVANKDSRITVWMNAADGLPLQCTAESAGHIITLVFSHYALNQPVAEKEFAARPPKDLALYQPPQSPDMPALLQAGTPAPDFTLSTLDGKKVTLSNLKGQAVLIDFWATWCGPCQMTMPHILSLSHALGKSGLRVLSVDTADKKDALQAWVKAHPKYDTTILFDSAGGAQSVAASKYLVTGIPTVYVIDKEGHVAATFVGYDPNGEAQIKATLATLGVR